MTAARVVVGDITRLDEQGIVADAVVNAANERLAAGSGVCGAIFAAAGHRPLTEKRGEAAGDQLVELVDAEHRDAGHHQQQHPPHGR